jgi:cytochrome c oxidase assembly protein subunit 15
MTDSLSSSKSAQTKSVQTKSADMAQQSLSSQNQGINQLIKPIIEPIILIRRIAFAIAISTWMVMAIGSATRVMNAGLACPDWPLCYGTVLPAEQMNLQVFLEWFHRLVASTVGFATIVLCGTSWYFRQSLPKWTPWATSGSFSLVVFQGILGGLTVTQLLRFDIVTAHLGTGLLFFSSLLAIATALTNQTTSEELPKSTSKLAWLGLAAAVLVYGQSILGALVASQWALHQCFATQDMCIVLNTHLLGVIPATIASVAVVVMSWLTKPRLPLLRRIASIAGLLIIAQVAIGYATYKLHLQVEPLTIAHQATGAALLGSLVCFTVLAFRDSRQDQPIQ